MMRFDGMRWRYRYLLAGVCVLVAVVWGVWLSSGQAETGPDEEDGGMLASSSEAGDADPLRGEKMAGDHDRVQRQAGPPATVAKEPGARETIQAFEEGLSCWKYVGLKKAFNNLNNDPKAIAALFRTTTYYPYTGDELERAVQKDLDFIEENEARCQGKGEIRTDGSLHEISLRAALAGSKMARYCYVEAGLMSDEQRTDPQQLERYRRYATRFLDEGMRSGDWGAVMLNMTRYAQPYAIDGTPEIVQTLNKPDRAMEYVYTRLFLLGADERVDVKDARILKIYEESLEGMKFQKSWKEIAELDRMADNLLADNFMLSQPFSVIPACDPGR